MNNSNSTKPQQKIAVKATEIHAGDYASLDSIKKILLPESITQIEEDAFESTYAGNFWCVEDSYAAHRIAHLCPFSKLLLFQSEDVMLKAWKSASIRKSWKEVRNAVSPSEVSRLAYKVGWTMEEARARAEQAYMQYGVSAKAFSAVKWRQWFHEHADEDPSGTWIEWHQKQVDSLEKSLDSGFKQSEIDWTTVTPRRITAKRYAAEDILKEQIQHHRITLSVLCAYLGTEIPPEYQEMKDKEFSRLAFTNSLLLSSDCIYFCWRPSNVNPSTVKNAGVPVVIGHAKYQEAFAEEKIPYIVSKNLTMKILELAALWRAQFPNTKAICITGSIGKTTTTEMVNVVASAARKTLCTWSNRNIPTSVAEIVENLTPDTEVYVQETSGACVGELEKSSWIIEPDIFIITNVGTSHIGTFGGQQMALLYEKTAQDRRAKEDAVGIVNYDDALLRKVPFRHSVVWFSMDHPDADYHAENIMENNGIITFDVVEKAGLRTPVKIHAFGKHNIYSALSAFAAGRQLGLAPEEVSEALSLYHSRGTRQNLLHACGRRVFVDCYNASENSVMEALAALKTIHVSEKGKRIAVLGDIKALGVKSQAIHHRIGEAVKNIQEIDEVYFFGPSMKEASESAQGSLALIRHTEDMSELLDWLQNTSVEDVILLKSSHAVGFDHLLDDWLGTGFVSSSLAFSDISLVDDARRISTDELLYVYTKAYGACVLRAINIPQTYTIPPEINGLKVRLICEDAFSGKDIQHLTCAPTIVTICDRAFAECSRLQSIDLSDHLRFIGERAFQNCTSLEEVTIPFSCETIHPHAFAGCCSLKRVQIPPAAKTIGENAFDKDCRATFLCSRNSYASSIIAEMCPNAKILFQEGENS